MRRLQQASKEVLSDWKRYKITDRQVNENVDDGKITVRYFDDSDDDEPIVYDVHDFITSADPAPVHINLVSGEVDFDFHVGRDQPDFEPQKRGEILPLLRKHVSDPKTWKNRDRKFDDVQQSSFFSSEEQTGLVPLWTIKHCKMGCANLVSEIVTYTREDFLVSAKRGVNEKKR